MKKARYWEKFEDGKVRCDLCPHCCLLQQGEKGICQVRINKEGELFTQNYGKVSSSGLDPIEKKPLYHFYPGTSILSLGTYGCNFKCNFCQNWSISQRKPRNLKDFTPEEVVQLAQEKEVCGIAYTYSEPMVWYEFVLETSKLAAEKDIKNVLVTNGYLNEEPLAELLPYIDAANVDLKSFSPEFYKNFPGGKLEPVLENIEKMFNQIHLEITTLLITETNDASKELNDLFSWIKDISPEIPLHLSRYFPNYNSDQPQTPISTMEKGFEIARDYLDFVYLGNVRIDKGQNTNCPQCGEILIKRNFYKSRSYLEEGKCPHCGEKIYGVF